MAYFHLTSSLLEFLQEAQDCFRRQPDRQYFLKRQKDEDHILWLLILDDPCQTMSRPNGQRTAILYNGSILTGYIDFEVLLSHCWKDKDISNQPPNFIACSTDRRKG